MKTSRIHGRPSVKVEAGPDSAAIAWLTLVVTGHILWNEPLRVGPNCSLLLFAKMFALLLPHLNPELRQLACLSKTSPLSSPSRILIAAAIGESWAPESASSW
jgi:hypothetical protein